MINVAIGGVGNCAKSLLEGIAFYTRNKDDDTGLIHKYVGKYHTSDINFVAAFDVDKRKVGKKTLADPGLIARNKSAMPPSWRF